VVIKLYNLGQKAKRKRIDKTTGHWFEPPVSAREIRQVNYQREKRDL